jgi:cell division protein FtsI (penicillin-binding protein 3)
VISRWARVRLLICGAAFAALALWVGRRAIELQIDMHEEMRGRAEDQYLKDIELPPQRGRILDRNEQELAATGLVDAVVCNPRQLKHVPDAVPRMAKALGLDARALRRSFAGARGEKYFAYVKRRASPEESARVMALGIPGVRIVKEPRRKYPRKDVGATVIGHANLDGVGIEGAERSFDKHLRGSPTRLQGLRDAIDRSLLIDGPGDPTSTAGKDVVLALDQYLMYVTDSALRKAIDKWQAKGATSVMMDPNTGEVLAMVSLPTYDPNDPRDAAQQGLTRNRAVTDLYEPGSTMKAITMATALEAKKVSAHAHFDCQDGRPYFIGRKAIKDDHPEGVLPFAQVFQRSSNIGTVKIAQRLGKEDLYAAIGRFGLGRSTRAGLPGEVGGIVHHVKKWGELHFATISFGYNLAVTPLQMTAAYAAIASGGIYRAPRIGLRVVHPDGRVEPLPPPAGARVEERVLSEKTALTMLDIMQLVTAAKHTVSPRYGFVGHPKGGTARAAAIDGYRVAGKTGTANKNAGGRYINKYVASFIGIVPADRPRLVISVVVDEPEPLHKGGIVAAPVFKEIAEAALKYLAVPPDPALLAQKDQGKDKEPDKALRAGEGAVAGTPEAGDQEPGLALDEPLWDDLDLAPADGEAGEGAASGQEPRADLVALPSFTGLTLGQAIQAARRAGVDIAPEGSGVAVAQTPSPGRVPRGSLCRVTFRPGT